jgi:hypothetical protein
VRPKRKIKYKIFIFRSWYYRQHEIREGFNIKADMQRRIKPTAGGAKKKI